MDDQFVTVAVQFPEFDIRRNHMGLRAQEVAQEAFIPTWTYASFREKDFSVLGRRHMEIEHRFRPVLHLGAWDITARGPRVGLALHNGPGVLGAQVESVNFLYVTR